MISNATGSKYYIRRHTSCFTPNVVYMAYCKNVKSKQGVGSTISWKSRLRNYKSRIKKNVRSSKIATHFIDECCDEEIPFKYLVFVIIDVVNNKSDLTRNHIEDILLRKEKLWTGTIVTQD